MDPLTAEVDAIAAEPVRVLRAGQLTEGWRWVFAMGWSLLVPALMAVGDAAHSLGKPTWWLDVDGTFGWWTPLPFLPLIAAAVAGATNWRWWPLAGLAGIATIGFSALADLGASPGVARGEAVLAAAGLATTVSAFAGRVRIP